MAMTALGQRTLQVAKRYIGVCEAPLGSNRGKVVANFQMFIGRWVLGQPWCAAFSTFCIHHAAKELGVRPKFIRSPSSSEIYRWAKRTGNLLSQPEPGCVCLVTAGPRAAPGKSHEHTCLVHTVEQHGAIVTVEGNWSNRVRWNHRNYRQGRRLDFVRIV